MSETAEKEKQSKPWQWPGEWMRDEKFWRDVASRTASGVLVVVIGLAYAAAAGYITSPDLRRFLFGLGMSLVILVPGYIWFAKQGVPEISKAFAPHPKRGRRIALALFLVALLVGFFTFWVLTSILVALIVPF